MADKLRTTYPLQIEFFAGEQPTAEKLSALSSQAKSGLGIVERAIGDLWGTGGDPNVSSLQIPNIGRVVGENKYLNPAVFSLKNNTPFYYIEQLNINHVGKTTGYLQFKPYNHPTYYLDFVYADADSQIGTIQAAPNHTHTWGADDIHIDATTGKFRVSTVFSSGTPRYIGYWVNPLDWEFGQADIVPSVIPDFRSATSPWAEAPVAGTAPYSHSMTLPLREALDLNHRLPSRIPIKLEHTNSVDGLTYNLNSQEGINGHQAFTRGPRLWAENVANASDWHRYNIPPLSSLAQDEEIPEGTMYLCYGTNYEVIPGLKFYLGASTHEINIKDTGGQLAAKLQQIANDPTAYPSQRFSIITCGSSISKSIWALANAYANHTHEGLRGESNLDHSTFLNLNSVVMMDGTPWPESNLGLGDGHIQYLHRDGNPQRDVNKGAMIGDLIMGLASQDNGNYLGDFNSTNIDSTRIYFGDNSGATSPYIKGGQYEPFNNSNFTGYGNPKPAIHLVNGSVNLGSNIDSHWLTVNTRNIRITADEGLVVYNDATNATHDNSGNPINRNYHGGISISSYRPRLDFIDRSTNAQDFRFESDDNSLTLKADYAGAGTWTGTHIEFQAGTLEENAKNIFHCPITWNLGDAIDGTGTDPDRYVLAYFPRMLEVDDSGTNLVTTADGFRMLYEEKPFWHANNSVDYLVFEKCDANGSPPDGGIAFTSNGTSGSNSVRTVDLIIRSGQCIFNGNTDEVGGSNANVYIKHDLTGGPYINSNQPTQNPALETPGVVKGQFYNSESEFQVSSQTHSIAYSGRLSHIVQRRTLPSGVPDLYSSDSLDGYGSHLYFGDTDTEYYGIVRGSGSVYDWRVWTDTYINNGLGQYDWTDGGYNMDDNAWQRGEIINLAHIMQSIHPEYPNSLGPYPITSRNYLFTNKAAGAVQPVYLPRAGGLWGETKPGIPEGTIITVTNDPFSSHSIRVFPNFESRQYFNPQKAANYMFTYWHCHELLEASIISGEVATNPSSNNIYESLAPGESANFQLYFSSSLGSTPWDAGLIATWIKL